MLSSITPLGQRGRGMSWSRTVVAFWVGAIAAGAAVFSAVGLFGELARLGNLNPWFSLAVIVGALTLDFFGVRPPGPSRQVDEDWLGRYRDWVLGLGYGAQLGVGVATIVPTYGLWALLLVAAAAGLPTAALVGVGFGLGRSLLLVSTRTVTSPSALSSTMGRFASAQRSARWVALAGYAVVVMVVSVDGI